GMLAAALFAALPITVTYGGQADVINTQLVFFILLSVAAYERFHDSPNLWTLGLLCLAFLPAAWTDWPAYYLVVVLGLHFIATRPLRHWPWIIAFGIVAALMFLAAYAHIAIAEHDWHWMAD